MTKVRNQYADTRKDFALLLELGRNVLAERSKDFYALWALASGLVWSKQVEQAEGFSGSCRLVADFCDRYWAKAYPAADGERNTLLQKIAGGWSNYLKSKGDTTPAEHLRSAADSLGRLTEFLKNALALEERDLAEKFPSLLELRQVHQNLVLRTKPATPPSAPLAASSRVSAAVPSSTNGEGAAAVAEPAESAEGPPRPVSSSLEKAFERARERITQGDSAAALEEFQRVLELQGEFAGQFKGQVYLGELFLQANLLTHAKRVLQYTHEQIDKIRLPQWDPKLCTRLWSALIDAHQREGVEKPDNKLLSDLFAQMCRLDPGRAASLEPLRDK